MKVKKKAFFCALGFVLLCAAAVGAYFAASAAERRSQPPVEAAEEAPSFIGVARESYSVSVGGKSYVQRPELTTILFIGVDDYGPAAPSGSYNNDGQADFLALLLIDNKTKTYSLLHLNRDAMTEITILGLNSVPAGSVTAQLAIAHAYGTGMADSCENTVKAVSTLLDGVRIDHYLSMTMDGVAVVNDLAGGVTVTIEDDFHDDSFQKGETVTLRGQQALRFVRARSEAGDRTNLNRMERQQQYLVGLIAQLSATAVENSELGLRIYEAAADYLVTDMDASELSELTAIAAAFEYTGLETLPGRAAVGASGFMEYTIQTGARDKLVKRLFLE